MARATPSAPTPQTLRDAALTHLSRFGTTQAGLLRVLHRRVDRWARATEAPAEAVQQARSDAAAVVQRLAGLGAVDDAAFAASRARSLHRAGRSGRAIAAQLAAKGVAPSLVQAALPSDPEAEFHAALAYARARRMGPFRHPPDPALRLRDLGRMARAGFAQSVASRALDADPADAEDAVLLLRQS